MPPLLPPLTAPIKRILLAWLLAATTLPASVPAAKPPALAPPAATAAAKPVFEEWDLIEMDGKACGFSSTITTSIVTPHGLHYVTELRQEFVIKRLGTTMKTTEVSHLTEDAHGVVLDFTQVESGMGPDAEMHGVRDGDDLVVTSRGETRRYRIPPPTALGPEAVRRLSDAVPLKAGTKFSFDTFVTDYPQAAVVEKGRVIGREDHLVNGVTRKLWKLTSEMPVMPGIETTLWVDDQNKDVESDLNVPGLGEMREIVSDRAACMKQPEGAEIFAASLIAPQKAIPSPNELASATYRLTTRNGQPVLPWDRDEQRVLKTGPGWVEIRVTVPPYTDHDAAYALPHADTPALHACLRPGAYLESNAPDIRALAKQAVGGETNPELASHRIEQFVERYITKKDLDIGFASAEETAKSREGDCTEHAVLCAALGRAAGIPTRCVLGLGYIPPGETEPAITNAVNDKTGLFGFHMWAEAWIGPGRWEPMDAALGGFDVGHIALIKSALDDVDPMVDLDTPILRLMQNLNITVLATVPKPEFVMPPLPASAATGPRLAVPPPAAATSKAGTPPAEAPLPPGID